MPFESPSPLGHLKTEQLSWCSKLYSGSQEDGICPTDRNWQADSWEAHQRTWKSWSLYLLGCRLVRATGWLLSTSSDQTNLTSQACSLINWENKSPEKGIWAERSLLHQRRSSSWLSTFTAAHEALSCGGFREWAAGRLHGRPQILVLCLVHKHFFCIGHTKKILNI